MILGEITFSRMTSDVTPSARLTLRTRAERAVDLGPYNITCYTSLINSEEVFRTGTLAVHSLLKPPTQEDSLRAVWVIATLDQSGARRRNANSERTAQAPPALARCGIRERGEVRLTSFFGASMTLR